ncbi:hypothetical protein NDU88_002293 [Pleurodeles waltl]|uniref:Endonuclease/exonuclease/phosphatase domain-containing protein n=1 Tax=Pleurodeles waltl TaxID=8319 RepID=A0AAV7UWQ6_PLEWA|nr:hypothetical protein NDU88_002293 [Pleurodeles waltl]
MLGAARGRPAMDDETELGLSSLLCCPADHFTCCVEDCLLGAGKLCCRGVLSWIRPKVPFELDTQRVVPERRYVCILGHQDGPDNYILGIYAPDTRQVTHLHSLDGFVESSLSEPPVLGGDFNCVLDILMWHLQWSAVEDEEYSGTIEEEIQKFFTENTGSASSPFMILDAFKVYIQRICLKTFTRVRSVLSAQFRSTEIDLHPLEIRSVLDVDSYCLLVQKCWQHSEVCTQILHHDYGMYMATRYVEGDRAGGLFTGLLRAETQCHPIAT